MIDRISPIAAINPPQTSIGVLTNTEMLLVSVIQGKRVLHPMLLPPERSDPSVLLEYLWQAELTEVWVMPDTPHDAFMTLPPYYYQRGRCAAGWVKDDKVYVPMEV